MSVMFLIARILFAVTFIIPGLQVHLLGKGRAMGTQMARDAGAPFPAVMVPVAGVAIVLAGLSIALGIWADIGAIVIAVYLICVTPIMHAFWKDGLGVEEQMHHRTVVMSNLAIAMSALIIFYAYNQLQGGAGLSLTDPLLSRL